MRRIAPTIDDHPEIFIERFGAYFSIGDGCWLWSGTTSPGGYGMFWNGEKKVIAHRFLYEMINGPIPDGMLVCHTCDVRNCVRPDHLFLGTHVDNSRDAIAKGRVPRGVDSPRSKLTEANVHRIRTSTQCARALAREIGVSRYAIYHVRNGRTWSHL